MLLPPKWFKHAVNLQLIEKNTEPQAEPHAKPYAEPHAKPHTKPYAISEKRHKLSISKFSTLSDKIKNANQKNDLCT